MSAKPPASRIEMLEAEFASRGMHPDAASDLACHLIVHHPLAQKLGVAGLATEIASRGMTQASALETTRVLLAVELIDRGADFDTMVNQMEEHVTAGGDALATALEGSRIHRGAAGCSDSSDEALATQLLLGVTAGALAALAVSVLLHMAIQ